LVDATGVEFYLDESGGKWARDPRLRRCGWGLAAIHISHEHGQLLPTCSFMGGFAGNQPGPYQTPNRACLEAMVFILQSTTGALTVKPDAAYLVNGFAKGRHLNPQGPNADLWHSIGCLVTSRGQPVSVIKVDAHLTLEQCIQASSDMIDYFGNAMADALAGMGAEISCVSDAIAEGVAATDATTWLILKRLLAVHMHFMQTVPKRNGSLRPKRIKGALTSFQRLGLTSGHKFPGGNLPRAISQLQARTTCTVCQQTSSRKTIKSWLKGPKCTGNHISTTTHGQDISRPHPDATIRVGRVDLHPSHKLLFRRGLWWCSSGYYTTTGEGKSSAKNLRKPCLKRREGAGLDYIRRIESGLMPKKGLAWPSPAHCCHSFLDNPMMARPRTRLASKVTLTLRELEAQNFPEPDPEEEDQDPTPQHGADAFEDENPFGISDAPNFDEA